MAAESGIVLFQPRLQGCPLLFVLGELDCAAQKRRSPRILGRQLEEILNARRVRSLLRARRSELELRPQIRRFDLQVLVLGMGHHLFKFVDELGVAGLFGSADDLPALFHQVGNPLVVGRNLVKLENQLGALQHRLAGLQLGGTLLLLAVAVVRVSRRDFDRVDVLENLRRGAIGSPDDDRRGQTRTKHDSSSHASHDRSPVLEEKNTAGSTPGPNHTPARRLFAACKAASSGPGLGTKVSDDSPSYWPPAPAPAPAAASLLFKRSVISVSRCSRASTETSFPSWFTRNIVGIKLIPHDRENSLSQKLPW